MDKYQKVISIAKEFLAINKRDHAHDLQHHKQVWETCQRIVQAEKLEINLKLLEVATFWHDVVVGKQKWPSKLMISDTCTHLAKLLPDYSFTPQEVKSIIETIKHHEFRDQPTTLEGLVLQDADKLDALSDRRWNHTLQEYRDGTLEEETIKSYMSTFLKWIPKFQTQKKCIICRSHSISIKS